MHIANVDALKAWLSKTLSPICDADPNTLARYVLALLKKDKPLSELHSVCLQELEVFLQFKTKDFVELLFTTLENGSFENNRPKTVVHVASSAAAPTGVNLDVQKSKSPEWQLSSASVTSKTTVKSDAMVTEPTVAKSSVAVVTAPLAKSDRRELPRTKSTSDRRSRSRDRGLISQLGSTSSRIHRKMSSRNEENHRPPTSRTRRSRSRNRNHSRERSRDRRVPISRRLGYQGSRDLRRHVDSIRTRSDRHSRDDRSHRRRSRSRSWRANSRSRSRSWNRLRSSPLMRMRSSQMRAYSRSKTRSKSRSPLAAVQNPSSPPTERSPKRASRSLSSEGRDENAYRIRVPLDVVLSGNPPPPAQSDALSGRAGGPSNLPAKVAHQPPPCPRCRDYDEKGFCLRGNLCPFDHGSDPLIFDDENIPGIVAFPGSQPGPLHPPPLPATVHPLPPMPPVILPSTLLAPPTSGIPLIATGASLIQPLPTTAGHNLLPAGVLLDPKYSPALNSSTPMMQTDMVVPMEASVAVSENSVIPVMPKDSGEGKRIVVPARRQVNVGVSQSSFPDIREATNIQDVRLVVRQGGGGRPLEPILSNDDRLSSFPKKHISSRLGIRKAIVSEENATLELTGVPAHLNTISSINQELSKYGTIVNIQVHYNGQSDRTLVSFARHAEASAAFSSSEPVFNNRFVSLLWHSTDRQDSVPDSVSVRKLSVKERLGVRSGPAAGIESSLPVARQIHSSSPQQLANNGMVKDDMEKRLVVLSPSGALTKTLFSKIPPSVKGSASSKVLDNRKTEQSKQTSNLNDLNKEQMKVKLEIAKQKQLLMKKHLEQQKALLVKLESSSLTNEEKKSLIQRMKLLERRMEKMKSELQDSATSLQPLVKSVPAAALTKTSVNLQPPKTSQNRLEIQKSILDAELDLIAKENQGVDTTDLKKSVAILKSQAAAQWQPGSTRGLGRGFRGRGTGRGGALASRGRGRAHLSLATKLIDRRPKQLVVSGFFPSEVDQIVASIAKFNGVESTQVGPGSGSILITFSSRLDAEKAALEGLKFKDRKLLMSWFDARKKPAPKVEEKKEEAEEEEEEMSIKQDMEEEEEEDEEEQEEVEQQEKEVGIEDSDSEVELIVEDDDEKDDDEELSGHVRIALDEDDVLDDSELLRLEEEDDDEDAGLLDQSWPR